MTRPLPPSHLHDPSHGALVPRGVDLEGRDDVKLDKLRPGHCRQAEWHQGGFSVLGLENVHLYWLHQQAGPIVFGFKEEAVRVLITLDSNK